MDQEFSPIYDGNKQQPWVSGVYKATYYGTNPLVFERFFQWRYWDAEQQIWHMPALTAKKAEKAQRSGHRFLAWQGLSKPAEVAA